MSGLVIITEHERYTTNNIKNHIQTSVIKNYQNVLKIKLKLYTWIKSKRSIIENL